MKSVSLPESLTEIGNSSFRGSGLEYVIIPDSVVNLGTYVFSGCTSLESVTLSSSVKTIPQKTFENCQKLKNINLPDRLEKIETLAFNGCTSLSSINFPVSLKQLENQSFENTGFTEITIPNTLTELGGYGAGGAVSGPFANCAALTKVVYAPGATSLGNSKPFYGCKSLREVVIPKSVTTVGSLPFAQCPNLRVVFYGGSEQEWNSIYQELVGTDEAYTVIYNFNQEEAGTPPTITSNLSDTTFFQNDNAELNITTAPADKAATYIYHWFEADQADGSDSRWKSSEVINVQAGESAKSVLPLTTSDLGTKYYYCEVSVVQDGKRGTVNSNVAKVTVQEGGASLTGEGTENDPYLLTNAADLATLRNMVNNGISMDGCYLRVENDIELGSDWTPIGTLKIGVSGADMGRNIIPFMGIFDGNNHTITFSSGSKPLFGYVREATIRNLNISAPYMDGAGLVNNYTVDYGSDGASGTGIPETVNIENVTIKSNSKIKSAGLIGGDGHGSSGSNTITISNCIIEENVIIGCDASGNPLANDSIGSFAGDFNGQIRNSVSNATVCGQNYVGGFVGRKGQSMGVCTVINSSFSGSIKASGEYVGGIIGSGFDGNSTAPNTPCVNIRNCYVKGNITGGNKVGGILGGEAGCLQAWENGKGRIQDNHFYGTVSALDQGGIRGGIIGFLPSLNAHNAIENNYYLKEDGLKGIGKVLIVDTSLHSDGTSTPAGLVGNVYYMNTAEDDKETIRSWLIGNGLYRPDPNNLTTSPLHSEYITNRTDDPLGKDADKLTASASEEDFSSPKGVLGKLNGSSLSLHNWILEEDGKYPVLSNQAVPYKIEISGNYTDSCFVGDTLDLSGIEFTVTWSDNTVTHPTLVPATGAVDGVEYVQISGFDSSSRKVLTLTASFQSIETTFNYTIKNKTGDPITISFTLLGDIVHPVSSSNTHTLSGGGLSPWIPVGVPDGFVTYTVDSNATVLDVVKKAVGEDNIVNDSDGNYIKSITWNGTTLAEFTNGPKSGWMYTLNGVRSSLGVAEQFLNDGDKIVFHYTDDYTKESAIGPTAPDRSSLLELIKQAEALNEADYTPESWDNLRGALNAARLTAADEGASTTDIEFSLTSLAQAMEALQRVKVPDFRQALKDTLYYIAQTVPAPSFGTTSGEWSVLALARGGYDPGAGYFDEYYDRIVEKVKSISTAPKLHPQKSTDNSRLILALSAIGRDPQNVGGVNLLTPLADMDWVEYQGVNGPIFALLALDANNYPNPGENTRQKLIDRIISNQLGNGGFSITPGGEVDLDMTAMALQALAPYKGQDKAGKAIDRALAYLSSVQNSNGGFGNTSEANVQVIVALSALGIDPKSDSRFVKSGGDPVTALLNYAVGNGGFKHLMTQTGSNAMATDQAGYALVAYTRMLDGQKRLYDMTDVELVEAGTVEVPIEPEVSGTTATAKPSLDAALETAKTENKGIISVTVSEKKADKVAVILNSITANAIAEANKTLNVTTENGGLSIAHETLKSIAEQAKNIASVDEIVLNVERKANEDEEVKAAVTSALSQIVSSLGSVSETAKQASIVEVTITVNNTPITQFGGNTLSIDLPVSSDLYAAGKLYKTLVISDGRTEEISGRCRDVNGKRVVTVRTTHLSTFVVIPVLAAAEPVEPEKPEKPGGNGEIEVRITILGDSVHGETSNPHTLAGNNLDTWVSQTTYTLKEGSTVWDLLKKVFNDNGMTCSNPSGNYVESITWRGKTLGEFTNGKYSGWMYTLNGTHPSLGVSEQVLEDGDRVVWHYTDDYTKEQGSEKWAGAGAKPELETGILQPLVTADKNGVALAELAYYEVENMIGAAKEYNWKELIIQPKVEGTASKIGIVLSKDITSMITDKSDLSLSLHTKYGNASLTNAGLTELSKTMKESLTMSVEKTETGTVKVDVLVDGKRVNTIKDGLRVTIPVEENGNVIAVIENGTEKIIRKSIVDGRNLLAVMDGSCELKVLDNSKSFGDLEGHWAKDAVAFASSHELFNGTGPERFEPDTSMSRAMLATVLYRLEDAVAEGSNPFADVASGTWYTDAVIWASGSGIVNGTGSGFAPDRNVTRQELVAMLYRYANSIGMDTGTTGSLDKFTDRNSVAEWARDAMGWAVANGLVNGRTATTLAPEGTATRAEVAAITQRLVTLMVK